jgi:hypothetical protein
VTITTIDSGADMRPTWIGSTDEVTASTITIKSAPGGYVTMLRLVCCPCSPGDILSVQGFGRITNDASLPRYNVGVGFHTWAYDADLLDANGQPIPVADKPWTRISPLCGDNVTPDRHHMPLDYFATWQVPADWPAGHRPVVVFRADAASTAVRSGDKLTVDQEYGLLIVNRWA